MRRAPLILALTLAGIALGAGPAAAAVTRVVDDDKAQCPKAAYTSIQAAVDAAGPGDNVIVCNGVYRERVTISGAAKNNLRLRANAVQGAIIRAPNDSAPAVFSWIVRVTDGATGVEVSRFIIERGASSGAAAFGLLIVNDATVIRARDNLIRRTAEAIRLGGGPGPGRALDVSYNTLQEYGSVGINVPGGFVAASFNTIIGQPGTIGILAVTQPLTAIGNRIFGNDGTTGRGILVGHRVGGVRVKYNTVSENGIGIQMSNLDNAEVAWNRVNMNQGRGLYVDGDSTGNRFDHNDARSNDGTDCQDDSSGGGTAGTANAWIVDRGIESAPPGICKP